MAYRRADVKKFVAETGLDGLQLGKTGYWSTVCYIEAISLQARIGFTLNPNE